MNNKGRMTAQQLKNSILQMAVQGKLVPQDPNDEPASVLLERIRSEKQKLIKEGKIKPDKKKVASDNLPYTDFPFEIPKSWEWVRLGDIVSLLNGKKITGKKLPYLDAKYLRSKSEKKILDVGIEIIAGTKVILVDGENSGEVFDINENGYMGSTFKILFFAESVFQPYILIFLDLNREILRKRKKGAAIPHLNKELFFNLLLPLPPLNEQKRIIESLERFSISIEDYGLVERKLTDLNKVFPNQLKKSLLSYAVQGKLVPQNLTDEPTSVLLEKIRTQKKLLNQSSKGNSESIIFRRDNSHYEMINGVERCIDEEIPFEIPESWEWVRLGNIFFIIMGQSPEGSSISELSNGTEFHQGKIFFTDRIIGKSNKTTNNPSKIATVDSVLLCVRAPVGKVNITDRELCIGRGLCSIRPLENMSVNFVFYWLETLEHIFIKKATGTTFVAITADIVNHQLIPLPPLEEQSRIVNQIEKILSKQKQICVHD
ncbi:MAG: restriction endonuclease subunit S [Methanosarcinales archaeon]|jgi:type I restriction enzyme S subunit|nr:restriction endonuclease subunit S [Methanosarcinales archaeon]